MNLKEERKLWRQGYKIVVGLDEAGRGPLAGPVIAAAVTIKPAKIKKLWVRETQDRYRLNFKSQELKVKNFLREVKDSKKLSPARREKLYEILVRHPAIEWEVGRVGNRVIDRINILEATKLAMERAVKKLNFKLKKQNLGVDFLILDGRIRIKTNFPQKSIVRADNKIFSCAAASIIAKVTRDRIMERYHQRYPQYNFDQHKGYPTKKHRKMLEKYGPCQIHRKSFRPIKILTA